MAVPPYTLADLRSGLVDHGFADMAVARQDELINDAYLDICTREDWPFLFERQEIPIAADTELVQLPSDFSTMQALVIEADGYPGSALEPMRPETAEKRFSDADTATGVPTYYWIYGPSSIASHAGGLPMNLKVWPMTDIAYTLTAIYIATPIALAGPTDVPVLPPEYQRTILMGALVNAYQLEDEIQMSQRQEQLLEKRLGMMRDLLMQQVDRPQVVIDVYASDDLDRVW